VGAVVEHARYQLAARLRSRRREIEQALLARVYGIEDPVGVGDSAYVDGFRAAAAGALDYALAVLEKPLGRQPLVPAILLSQASLAARNGVGLDTVLRRYTAGHSLLVDFLIEEVEIEEVLSPSELRRLLTGSASAFDRLLSAVSDEYGREGNKPVRSSREQANLEQVERILAGEPGDLQRLSYELDGWHVGLVVSGQVEQKRLVELAHVTDRRILAVEPATELTWVWLGGRRETDIAAIITSSRSLLSGATIAVGEPALGLPGWKLTHRQAESVLLAARKSSEGLARFCDQGLLASVCRDQVLIDSLHQLYVEPLAEGRDGGEVLRETLQAYFEAGCNVSSAGAALEVHRQTVTSRLRIVEEKLGRPLADCAVELNLALQLTGLQGEAIRGPDDRQFGEK
jgi:hypothetical protein